MFESKERYLEIVRQEVQRLEKLGGRISDGGIGFCPRCGTHGMWDILSLGFVKYYSNSIYFSTVFNEWRCRACDSGRQSPPSLGAKNSPKNE